MVDFNTVRVRWRELVEEARTGGLVDDRTVRISRFFCFDRIAQDLARYPSEVQTLLLLQLVNDPKVRGHRPPDEDPRFGTALVLEITSELRQENFLRAAHLLEDYLGLPRSVQ